MKRIILEEEKSDTVRLSDVDTTYPIFAKQGGMLKGMLVKENDGWILRTGFHYGATGHHTSIRKCIESCSKHGYDFFINDKIN